MDSINPGMSATRADGLGDDARIYSPLTEIYEGVEHPECVVILAEVETFLMEQIHSSVVTVKPRQTKR